MKQIYLTAFMLFAILTSKAQNYTQVFNLSGTSVVNGITVSVTSSGTAGNFPNACGPTASPYFVGGGAGSFTFTFSAPIGSATIPVVFGDGGIAGQVHFSLNGSSYPISDANLEGSFTNGCSPGTASVSGGDLVNTGYYFSDPDNVVVIPGPITSITVSSIGADLAIFGMYITSCTYFNITNTSGTSLVNGVTTTVTSTSGGVFTNACGPTASPYMINYGDQYNYSFSSPVDGINVPGVFGFSGTAGTIHFIVNGSGVSLTNSNLNGQVIPNNCTNGAATISGGDFVNTNDIFSDASGNIMLPNSGTINSASIVNTGSSGADNLIYGMFFTKGTTTALSFNNTSNQFLGLCMNASATSINSFLAVTDANSGLQLTWSLIVNPLHGSIITGGAQTSNGGSITPTGFTYQPTTGYNGTDGFTIQVTDGVNTVTTTINVSVVLNPSFPESFEEVSFPPQCSWLISNNTNYPWSQQVGASAYGIGNQSAKMDFWDIFSGLSEQLTTYQFTPTAANYGIQFDEAYASYFNADDQLEILYSTNGGGSWTSLVIYDGGDAGPLNTGGDVTSGPWTPASNQWNTLFHGLPAGTNMIQFDGLSAFGNNLYLDNVNIVPCSGPVVTISGGPAFCGSGVIDAGVHSSYLWGDNSSNQTLTVSASGTYSVTVSDGNGCTAVASQLITMNTIPIAGSGYTQVTNTNGTVAYGGVNVTVTSSGGVTSFTPCGTATAPYYFTGGTGTYNFSFSSPVTSVEIPVIFASGGTPTGISFTVNGTYFPIASCNILGNAVNACGDNTLAVISGGNLINPSSDYTGTPNAMVLISGTINSISLTNTGANGALNGLYFSPNTIPTFTNSSPQLFTICENAGATSINSLLTVNDVDGGQTETWSVTSSPSHGTLGGFNSTASSGSTSITPLGLTYTPSNGYTGSDQFVIQVSDGIATSSMTVNVMVNAVPVAGSGYTQVTNTNGTVAYGGVNVTVTSSGGVTSFTPCGTATAPYYFTGGTGTYNFSFSSPVTSVEIPVIFASGGTPTGISFTVNGTYFPIASCNILGNAINACGDNTLAVIFGGNLINPSSDYTGTPNATVLISGTINSISLTNIGANGALNGLYFNTITIPTFTNSNPQLLTICENAGATSINSMLTVSDVDAGQTETWSVTSTPSHGTLGGFNATASSGSTSITPSGLTYTPSNGYIGSDQFIIQVSDGVFTSGMTVNVIVNANPTPSITGGPSFCGSGNLDAGVYSTYHWSDNSTNETLFVNSSNTYSVTVTNGNGCIGTTSEVVTVYNPGPFTLPFTELFTGQDCWTVQHISGSEDWNLGTIMNTGLAPASGEMMLFPSGSASNGTVSRLISPPLDFTGVTEPVLNYHLSTDNGSQQPDSVAVSISTNGGATYTFLRSALRRRATSPSWTLFAIDLAPYANTNNIKIAFDAVSAGGGNDMAIDDVSLFNATCPEPINCNSTNVGLNSATLNWQSGGGSPSDFVVRWSTSISDLATWNQVTLAGNVNSYTINGLAGNTTIYWQVKSDCSGNTSGFPVAYQSFHTSTCPSSVTINSSRPNLFLCPAGSMTLTASSGFNGYTWSNSASTQSITISSANTYSVIATNIGCPNVHTSVMVIQDGNINLTSPNYFTQVNVSCNGGSNGIINVNPTGGYTPYTYTWSPVSATTATVSGLSASSYTVTVTDAKGCSNSKSTTIGQPTPISLVSPNYFTQSNVTCNGGNNGIIRVNPSGGTPGYNYSWTPSEGNNATISNLAGGTYMVAVTDANNCTATKTTIISQPPPILIGAPQHETQINPTCANGHNGIIRMNPAGGIPPYSYSWSPNVGTTATVSNLSPGSYSVTVTDANGCTKSNTIGLICTSRLEEPNVSIASSFDFNVYPNPAGGLVTISFTSDNENLYSLRLVDMLGRIIKSEVDNAAIGENSHIMNLDGVAKGMYMILLQKGDDLFKSKLVVE